MEVSGIVKRISEVQNISASFRKREIVVTTEEQYPQHLSIEFVQDKTDLLDQYKEGDKVTIGINLRGREWTSPQGEVKYFNSIQGWRIAKGEGTGESATSGHQQANPTPPSGGSQDFQQAPPKPMAPLSDDEDDLPF